MTRSSKIVFFGNERLSSGFEPHGAPTLQALIDQGYDVVAVVANYQEATSRKARQLEVKEVAERHNIPVLLPDRPADILNELAAFKAPLGVLVAYGRLVPQSVIDIFPQGIVNIHPSLLPQYRGSTPIEQAILDGVAQTGVSLMQLVKAMDAGPVYAQAVVQLTGSESKVELTQKLLTTGSELLVRHLPAILNGSLMPTPQDESKATFTRLITKVDGQLNLAKPAQQLQQEVRAYATWPKSRLNLYGQDIIVTKSRVATSAQDGNLVVAAGNQTYLEITELVGPSGRTMSGADFLRGYKK